MLRSMIAGACLLATTLASCTGTPRPSGPPIDLCAGAAIRRSIYAGSIAAADAWPASGRPLPTAMMLGREAAVTALSILDTHCQPASR